MTNDIRHRQEHIEFLENYITSLTEQIDELTQGRDFEKMIRKLEFRIEVLKKSDENFSERIKELEGELKEITDEYTSMKPILEHLESERSYYRTVQGDL